MEILNVVIYLILFFVISYFAESFKKKMEGKEEEPTSLPSPEKDYPVHVKQETFARVKSKSKDRSKIQKPTEHSFLKKHEEHVETVSPKSRARKRIKELKNRQDLIIYQTILDKPRSLNPFDK